MPTWTILVPVGAAIRWVGSISSGSGSSCGDKKEPGAMCCSCSWAARSLLRLTASFDWWQVMQGLATALSASLMEDLMYAGMMSPEVHPWPCNALQQPGSCAAWLACSCFLPWVCVLYVLGPVAGMKVRCKSGVIENNGRSLRISDMTYGRIYPFLRDDFGRLPPCESVPSLVFAVCAAGVNSSML